MIPSPKQAKIYKKCFWVTSKVIFRNLTPLPEGLYRYLVTELDSYYTKVFAYNDLDDDNVTVISFVLAPFRTKVPDEYYHLKIDTNAITLSAEQPAGLCHAIQTLKQHWLETSQQWIDEYDPAVDMHCLDIKDWPSFLWRGLHLDVSRHFFDFKFIRRYLDWMAFFKLNKFHWHLSDDQGWRVESKRFPLLHQKGSLRKEADGSTYGGYYTQKQIKLVLDYAAQRNIEVIPEIDIPGHAQAILAAYPQLACFPQEFETLNVWGISENILCAGKDTVIDFLKELFTEIAELFPGKYIHIGGDEAPKDRWKACPDCQKRIHKHKLHNEEELQSWLIKTLVKHLQSLGKTVIGWDEILDGNIDSKPIVMVWRGDGVDAARKAHDNGNKYILCPYTKFYFDAKNSKYDKVGTHQVINWQDVLKFPFQPYQFPGKNLLLGAQANVWTEHITNVNEMKEKVLTRIDALAERLWCGDTVADPKEFMQRALKIGIFI